MHFFPQPTKIASCQNWTNAISQTLHKRKVQSYYLFHPIPFVYKTVVVLCVGVNAFNALWTKNYRHKRPLSVFRHINSPRPRFFFVRQLQEPIIEFNHLFAFCDLPEHTYESQSFFCASEQFICQWHWIS